MRASPAPAGRRLASGIVALAAAALAVALASAPVHAAPCTLPVQFGPATQVTTGPNPLFMVAADFNGDGLTDLAVTNSDFLAGSPAGNVAVLLGAGPLAFAAPVTYPLGVNSVPHGLVGADFNGDGILDLAVSNKFNSTIQVLLGLGAGGVGNGAFAAPVSFAAGGYPFQLVSGDFNGDGAPDLAAALNNTPAVTVLLGHVSGGHGDGTFAPPALYPLSRISTGIATGDFNHDGALDLAATEQYSGTVGVLLGRVSAGHGDGTFNPAVHYPAGPEPFSVAVDDFNGDGVQDLAVGNASYGGTAILLGHGAPNAGDGTFGAPSFLPSGNSACVVALDANGDGIRDLAVGATTGSDGGDLLVYLGHGAGGVGDGTFDAGRAYVSGSDAYQVLPYDLDRDGKTDLVYAAYLDDFVGVLPGVCAEEPPDPRLPVLTHVKDVPLDQGGKVFVTWTASSLDRTGGSVTGYRVWRRIPTWLDARTQAPAQPTGSLRAVNGVGVNSTQVTYWEALATLPAQRLAGYGYTAATLSDSSAAGNPYTAFFVSALTNNIDTFYDSSVDSGYSVDNLAPQTPSGFAARAVAGPAIGLRWLPNPEPDLAGYRLYRGDYGLFAPSPENLLAAVSDTGYVDPTPDAHYYKLTAVDTHGNESEVAAIAPTSITGVGEAGEARFALRGAQPNPAAGDAVTIAFSLPAAGRARVTLLDVAGRIVRASTLLATAPGPQTVRFAGARLRDGVYLVRLEQAGRSAVTKVVIRN